jgi:SET family sugar efflux transporter-like MFS transporter
VDGAGAQPAVTAPAAPEATPGPPQAFGLPVAPAAALAWGLQFAFFNPAIALILADRFGASDGQIGLALALYNASGFVSSLVIPVLADRRSDYLSPLLWAGLATLPLAAVLGLSHDLTTAVVALVVLGGPVGVGTSLLFAHLRAVGLPPRAIINTRAVFSFAWVAGPPLATLAASTFGDAAVLACIAVIAALGLATTWAMRRASPPTGAGGTRPGPDAPTTEALLPVALVGVVVAFVALQATNYISTTVMALYVTSTLHLPTVWAGVALAVAAGLEIPALVLAGRLTTRYSNLTLIAASCVLGAGYYLALALAHGPVELVASQVLNAAFFAIVAGIGLTFFQEIIPAPGLASGLFTNLRRVGAVAAGGIVALAGVLGGYRHVFLVCAGLSVLALALVVPIGLLGPRLRRPVRA